MANYKLTYFEGKARAESIRFLMKYGNVHFEDDRFAVKEWPKVKPTKPFEKVPVLTHNGKEYIETLAICRYMAKKVKLMGDDDLEDMEIDSIADTINDMAIQLARWVKEPNEEIKMLRKDAVLNEKIPFFMERFDKIVKENNGHFVSKKLTWADLFFVSFIDTFDYYTASDSIGKYENLRALRDKVLAIPNIKKWVEERPKTVF